MRSSCPDCGYELYDMAQELGHDPDVGSDALDLFNEIVGYYCSSCNDFYSPGELQGRQPQAGTCTKYPHWHRTTDLLS